MNSQPSPERTAKKTRMTSEEIQQIKTEIDCLSHEEMAIFHRFAPSGHPYFNTLETDEIVNHFKQRFEGLGGMTTSISKKVGWDSFVPRWED